MSLSHAETPKYTFKILCPKCGAKGVIEWEGSGRDLSLVSLTRDFYERLAKKAPYPIELVCACCDTVQKHAL